MILHLRALVSVQYVLHHKGMETETIPETLYDLRLMESLDIDPCDCGFIFKGETLFYGLYLYFLKMCLIIINDRDADLFSTLFSNMDKCPGRKPTLLCPLFDQTRHSHNISWLRGNIEHLYA